VRTFKAAGPRLIDTCCRLILALLILGAIACHDVKSPSLSTPEPTIEQRYLFDSYYVNFSWGYTLRGTFVDEQGNVIRYDHSFEQWTAANFDSLSRAELDEKFIAPTDTIAHIDRATLLQMYKLIEPASQGELSEREFMGPDQGGSTRICYRYDEETDHYIKVLLSLTGTYRQTNLSEAAMVLDDWFRSVLAD